jgi:hypothetical protein
MFTLSIRRMWMVYRAAVVSGLWYPATIMKPAGTTCDLSRLVFVFVPWSASKKLRW